jgi:hypothetical protein
MKKKFISVLTITFMLFATAFSMFTSIEINKSTDLSLESVITTANAQSEGGGGWMICYYSFTSAGETFFLQCESQYFCLYGYGVPIFQDECAVIG